MIAVRAGEGRGQSGVLWAGLALFVAVSSFFGFDAAMRGLIGTGYQVADLATADAMHWVRAVLGGAVLPVQYLLAVAAGHQLAAGGESAVRARTSADRPRNAPHAPREAPRDRGRHPRAHSPPTPT